jgi:putative methylase
MSKRLTRKIDLEMLLSHVQPHPTPSPDLEQYTVPIDVASTLLYLASYVNNDVVSKTVLDLGCGTGRLALGAAFLGAKEVTGVDIDTIGVRTAFENSIKVNLKQNIRWIVADITAINGRFDTVLQNPPFGVQKKGADTKFLKKALELGRVVYSLHKSAHKDRIISDKLAAKKGGLVEVFPSPFLREIIEKSGGRIRAVYALVMTIPHMFNFHLRKKHEFAVDLYVVERKRN